MNADRKRQESLESRIALFWLHRLGIVTLVLGVVFLITYSMQNLSPALAWLFPWFKLGAGFGVSLAMLWLGEKITGKDEQKWFSQALTAGGWSLAYFTTYAAHYIPSVNVIASLPVETALLSLVAAGALYSSLKARSELMAIYSVSLAAGTILISGPGLYSDISFLIIALAASILGNTQSWRKLFAYALAVCYAGHFYCTFNIFATGSERLILTAFLSALWLVFSLGIGFSLRTPSSSRNMMTILACANATLFALGLDSGGNKGIENLHQLILVGFGLLYLVTSRWLNRRDQVQLSTVHALLGLSFVNVAKLMHYSGLTLLSIDVVQIALLSILAIRYNIKAFRYAAAALTFVFGFIWMGGVAAHVSEITFGIRAIEYFREAVLAVSVLAMLAAVYLRTEGKNFYFHFNYFVGNFLAICAVLTIEDICWRGFAYALLTMANFGCGVRSRDDYYVDLSFLHLVLAASQVIFGLPQWQTVPIALCATTFYAGYFLSTQVRLSEKSYLVQLFQLLVGCAGAATLTALILQKAPSDYCSTQLAVEAIALLACGLAMKNPFLRHCGLIVLALLSGKLLFVDLANHNTFERILSFIAAGVIFLLASYLYSRFSGGFGDEERGGDVAGEAPREGSAGGDNGAGDIVGGCGLDCSQPAGVEA